MDRVRAAVAHRIPDRTPMQVRSGDVVEVGDHSTEWPAFVFVTAAHGSGWVPSGHLSATAGRAIVETPYDTTELATSVGEELEVIHRDDESGWLWCRNGHGTEGWIPIRTLESPGNRTGQPER